MVARAIGFSVSEIADVLGWTRPHVYDVLASDSRVAASMPLHLLAVLAGAGALTADALAAHLRADHDGIDSELRTLRELGLVDVALTNYEGGETDVWFRVTPTGEDALARGLDSPEAHPERHAVYAAISPAEREALQRVAIDFFGPDWFTFVEPGTVTGQDDPELAFHVLARSHDIAVIEGARRLTELRRVAGLPVREPQITATAPADRWHARFGGFE